MFGKGNGNFTPGLGNPVQSMAINQGDKYVLIINKSGTKDLSVFVPDGQTPVDSNMLLVGGFQTIALQLYAASEKKEESRIVNPFTGPVKVV